MCNTCDAVTYLVSQAVISLVPRPRPALAWERGYVIIVNLFFIVGVGLESILIMRVIIGIIGFGCFIISKNENHSGSTKLFIIV